MSRTVTDLVRASQSGDTEAFGQLVERYQSLVRAAAVSASGDLAASEELTQEAFITAWTRLRDLREPAQFGSWVCGIARNQARYSRRHRRRHAPVATESQTRLASMPTETPSPLDCAIDRQERVLVRTALGRIPRNYREPLLLFYGHNHTIAEVAGHLGLTHATVKQRLSRGRKYLKSGVQELLRTSIGQRPVSVGAAVLLAIATIPQSPAGAATSLSGAASAPGSGAASPFAALTATEIAIGGVLVAGLVALAVAVWPSDTDDDRADEIAAPIADTIPTPPPRASRSVTATPTPPTTTVPGVAREPSAAATTTAIPGPANANPPRRADRTSEPGVPTSLTPDEHGVPVVLEFGPVIESQAAPRPALSLMDALDDLEREPPAESSSDPGAPPDTPLPIEPPDFRTRVLDTDL